MLAQDLNDDCRPDLIASFNSGKTLALINRRAEVFLLPENIGRSRNLAEPVRAELALPQWPAEVPSIKLGKFVSSSPNPKSFLLKPRTTRSRA